MGAELMEVDLVPLNMVDFDLILGMNWLSRHHAHIDYHRKLVTFRLLGDHQWNFRVNKEFYQIV